MSKLSPDQLAMQDAGSSSNAPTPILTDRFYRQIPSLTCNDNSDNRSFKSSSTDSGVDISTTSTPKRKWSSDLRNYFSSKAASIGFPLHNNYLDPNGNQVQRINLPFTDHPLPDRGPNQVLSVGVNVQFTFESPPIVIFGDQAGSSGAIFTGLLDISFADLSFLAPSAAKNVTGVNPLPGSKLPHLPTTLDLSSVNIKIVRRTYIRRVNHSKCSECCEGRDVLMDTNYSVPNVGINTVYNRPVSYLFPGHSPATTVSPCVDIRYYLEVESVLRQTGRPDSPKSKVVKWEKELMVHRSIVSVEDSELIGNMKLSIRNISNSPVLIQIQRRKVVYPNEPLQVDITIKGLFIPNDPNLNPLPNRSYRRWVPTIVGWTLFQKFTINKTTCKNHKLRGSEHDPKHTILEKLIGGSIRNGWKLTGTYDANASNGNPNLSIQASLEAKLDLNLRTASAEEGARRSSSWSLPAGLLSYADSYEPIGYSVVHQLDLNIQLNEELVSPDLSQPSGDLARSTGRAISVKVNVPIRFTEKPVDADLGAWDQDVPPTYSCNFAFPPEYGSTTDEESGRNLAIPPDYWEGL